MDNHDFNAEYETAVFFLDEAGKVAGATFIEADPQDGGYSFISRKPRGREAAELMLDTIPEDTPVGRMKSSSGRSFVLVWPMLNIPSGALLRFLDTAERIWIKEHEPQPKAAIAIRPNPAKS